MENESGICLIVLQVKLLEVFASFQCMLGCLGGAYGSEHIIVVW